MELVLLATVVVLGGLFWAYQRLEVDDGAPAASLDAERLPPLASVAVLPFEDPGSSGEDAYFSQGLSDQIRAVLARVPDLHVASRTSSHALGASGRSAAEIADELGVGSILEGSVQRAGSRVRVTVSLVDARSDRQLWTETFDRELDVESLFAVEGEIARAVARALQVEVDESVVPGTTDMPASFETHDLYLLGLYHWGRRTGPDMLRARQLFQDAVVLDPDYAPARAGLAKTHLLLPLYAEVPADIAMPEAREAAETALSLDPGLAEAHAALGLVRTAYDWDWEAAEDAFLRALELDPRYATGHQWYGLLLNVLGRHDEARTHHSRAAELDPLSPIINELMGNHLTFRGEYDQAVAQLEHTLSIRPDFPLALRFLGHALLLAGRFDEAEEALRRWARVAGTAEEPWSRVVRGVENQDDQEAGIGAVEEMAEGGVLTPYWQAQYYALLGARAPLLAALDEGVRTHDFLIFFVAMDPAFDAFRTDEAFEAVLRPVGFPAHATGG